MTDSVLVERLAAGAGLELREAGGLVSLAKEFYSAPERHYHVWDHALGVFDTAELLLDEAADIEPWERGGVLVAALFHDAIYDPRAPKGHNEEGSANVLSMGWGAWLGQRLPSVLAEAKRLILLTVDHVAAPSDIGGQILCDADLAGFAVQPYVEFQRQNDAIRLEYSFVSDEDWLDGRQAVLERYLYRNPMYYRLGPGHGDRATLNIVRAIRELRAAQALNERRLSTPIVTPDEWQRRTGIQILDPDGWRPPYLKSWGDPITRDEFIRRAQICTTKAWPSPLLDERLT